MDSFFRRWFEIHLRALNGGLVEWPQLLRRLFYEEIQRLRTDGIPYAGSVFIDRDETARNYAIRPDQHREDLSVYRLYRHAHESHEGALLVGETPVWLVCCQVPNQGALKGRRADLIGIRGDGSLVLFECKAAGNTSDSPLLALLEGLDYLGHLLIDDNFSRFCEGLDQWRLQHAQEGSWSHTPPGFESVSPQPSARHAVIVLGPQEYFERHRFDNNGTPESWNLLSDRAWPNAERLVDIEFWACEFPLDGEPLEPCIPVH